MFLYEKKRINRNELNELIGELKEVKAYRDLQDEPFDFGTGLITNDSRVSEDVYYKMRQHDLEDLINDMLEYPPERKGKKARNSKYARKCKTKRKLKKLKENNVYEVYEKVNKDNGAKVLVRTYNSGRKKYAKKMTNRQIRMSRNDFSLKGGGYRKKFDYWWTVF